MTQRASLTIRNLVILTVAGVAVSLSAGSASAQLYASDSTSVKSGDLMDRDYWRAKWGFDSPG